MQNLENVEVTACRSRQRSRFGTHRPGQSPRPVRLGGTEVQACGSIVKDQCMPGDNYLVHMLAIVTSKIKEKARPNHFPVFRQEYERMGPP
jgi:hypothetical protein